MTRSHPAVGEPAPGVAEEGLGTVLAAVAADEERDELVSALIERDPEGLLEAKRGARRLVQDDGITYGGTPDGEQARLWEIDPIPVVVGEREWGRLQAGLQQRARTLRALFDDLYGERTLLRRGVLPAALVLGHPGYLRPALGIPPANRPLLLGATDLGRDADGSWRVLSDRWQAPSGAGYAMATRRVVARLLPRLHRTTRIATLASFFHTLGSALAAAAPAGEGAPRTVMLSPGTASETAFDQAFLASALGIPLVEADDVVVRDGRPYLRAGHGEVPVDVVLRRVDELWADPLELLGESTLGVPGLLEATRRGLATVVNPFGSGALENVGLAPYFAEVTRALLGEEPVLEAPETWWCGDPASRSHVRANLDELLIRPTDRERTPTTIEGWRLDAAQRDRLLDEIERRPWAWAAQRPLPLSTTPTVAAGGVEQRRFVLRTFGTWHDDDFVLMRGGLGRVAAEPDEHTVSNERGALATDVWVLGDSGAGPRTGRERIAVRRGVRGGRGLFEVTPRVADHLHWFGRYAERADATTRLLAVAGDLAEDHAQHPGSVGNTALGTMLAAVRTVTQVRARRDDESVVDYLSDLVVSPAPHGTIAASVGRVVHAAHQVRELVSDDTWAVLAELERAVDDGRPHVEGDEPRARFDALLGPLLALEGMIAHGLYRDDTWAFIDSGVRMERAQSVVSLLEATLTPASGPVVEFLVAESILRVCDSAISHRRRVANAIGPAVQVEQALDLLLLDAANPRSVAFQLSRIGEDLRLIGDERLAPVADALGERLAALDLAELTDDRERLAAELAGVRSELRAFADRIERRHFARRAPHSAHQERWAPTARGHA